MILVMYLQNCVSRFAAKKYNTNRKRFAHFAKNLKLIAYHNKLVEQGEYTYRLGLNKYSDLVRLIDHPLCTDEEILGLCITTVARVT